MHLSYFHCSENFLSVENLEEVIHKSSWRTQQDVYQLISKRTLQKFLACLQCDLLLLELEFTILCLDFLDVFRCSSLPLTFLPPCCLAQSQSPLKQKSFSSSVVFCNVFLCSEASGYNSMPKPTSVGKKGAVVSKSNSAKCFTSALANTRPLQVMEGSCWHPLWVLK